MGQTKICKKCGEDKGAIFTYDEMMMLAPTLAEIRRRRNA